MTNNNCVIHELNGQHKKWKTAVSIGNTKSVLSWCLMLNYDDNINLAVVALLGPNLSLCYNLWISTTSLISL